MPSEIKLETITSILVYLELVQQPLNCKLIVENTGVYNGLLHCLCFLLPNT